MHRLLQTQAVHFQFLHWFSNRPEWITGGLGSEASQGMGFFSSSLRIPFLLPLSGGSVSICRKALAYSAPENRGFTFCR